MRTITRFLVCAVASHPGACRGPAFAQTEDAYNGLAGAQQGGGGDAAAADTGGSLPFTGLELALVAIAGAGLLGVGYVVRRSFEPSARAPP